ncbi:uncharacterized protein LOC123261719 [Cotesia glomerata]|uniref:uncharacterized protein LOC123261719 n=1 Tax=Cotesia glomerata TaxID=32391 RepID=UPI001D02E1E5|nr:uncharacterized protein LOC123261719 [Cotesia glomerata]
MSQLILIVGNKKDSKIYGYGPWEYYDSKGKEEPVHFYCTQRKTKFKCPVELKRKNDGYFIVDEKEHNHPKPKRKNSEEVKRELKKRAVDPMKTSDIAKVVLKSVENSSISYASARQIITKTKLGYQSIIPQTLFELSEMLRTNPLYEKIYIGHSETPNQEDIAIVLGSENMLKELNEASDITIETTSRCLPENPAASHLLTIHINKFYQGVASVYVICSSLSEELYDSIIKFLLEKCSKLHENLKKVICNFDERLIVAIRQNFKTVIISGSWIHFIKLLNRKWLMLNLPESFEDEICIISCLLKILPLLKINEALRIINDKAEIGADKKENLLLYSRFVRNCEPFITNKLFIGDNRDEAINPAELFLVELISNLDGHRDIYSFLDDLKLYIKKTEVLINDTKFLKNKTVACIKINYELSVLQRKLMKDKISLQDFINEFKKTNLHEHIMIQLKWPQYTNDTGKLTGVPSLKTYLVGPPSIDEKFTNPCLYCLSVEASIQVRECSHFIACYLCWINDFYGYERRTCPACRQQYENVNMM